MFLTVYLRDKILIATISNNTFFLTNPIFKQLGCLSVCFKCDLLLSQNIKVQLSVWLKLKHNNMKQCLNALRQISTYNFLSEKRKKFARKPIRSCAVGKISILSEKKTLRRKVEPKATLHFHFARNKDLGQ